LASIQEEILLTRAELEHALATDFANPAALKSGEYLAELILARIGVFLPANRSAVIELMREWLDSRSEPRTMLAVTVVKSFGLIDLHADLTQLLADIQAGSAFRMHYAGAVEEALTVLNS
jgi:hypothetical protein